MGIRSYKPSTAGRRHMTVSDFEELAGPSRPVKKLCLAKRRTSGRNNQGRITVRHRGGGHKRKLRLVDFRRQKRDVFALVKAIQYDPNRSAHVALLHYVDGEKAYILWPVGLKVGDKVVASEQAEIQPGNHLPLRNIPLGTPIHNLEIKLGRGGQLIRASGAAGQVLAKEGGYAQVRLPSGEVRKVHGDCWATVGQVGNVEHENISIGKAGRNRWLGWRPTVRGAAQNPVDHPHGGGEGRAGQGNPHPVSPWGWHTKGHKTRRNPRTDKWIVRRRK